MSITLTQADFEGVGEVAKHCDNAKLKIAIEEAIEFDLKPLLCNLFYEVSENWEEESGVWADIIKGKSYVNCGGFTTTHRGLKKVLVYYAYARYVVLANFSDTPNGHVTKTNNFSIPKPLAELKQFSNKYRNMGLDSYKLVEAYILKNRQDYSDYNFSGVLSCGCNGSCGTGTKNKGFGLRSRNISR